MAMAERVLAAAVLALAASLAQGQLPARPGAAAAEPVGTPIALVNPGFESAETGPLGNPEGWFSYQHAGPRSYEFDVDDTVAKGGRRSFRITNVGPEPFGTISQGLPARELRGKTLRYSAWIRTQDVQGNRLGKGAQMRIVAMRSGSPVAHNFGRETAASGTTEWTRKEISLTVPPTAETVEIGALLFGPGKLWLDDATLEIVDEKK